jgi:type IV pilus assembly protein PilA
MKPEVTLKYLSYLRNKKNAEEGFTLIELLVVVIIIGVLAAVALPNLLNQVGKARESEIKTAVGTVNRSQQAYHFERREFADNLSNLGLEQIAAGADYLDSVAITGGGAASTTADVISNNAEFTKDGTRAYSAAIEFGGGVYSQILCQTDTIADVGINPTSATACAGGSAEIK